MASQEWQDNFNMNMDTISRFAGLAPLPKEPVQTKECPHCDCEEGEHKCIVCGEEIGPVSCLNREGHCITCWDDLQYSLKN